jgi:hypothetical protein
VGREGREGGDKNGDRDGTLNNEKRCIEGRCAYTPEIGCMG